MAELEYDDERDPDQEAVEEALNPQAGSFTPGAAGSMGRAIGSAAGTSVRLVDSALTAAGRAVGPVAKKELPDAPTDDFSDLLRGPSSDDPMMDASDLTSVSREDVYGDEGDDFSDLFDVSEEDVMGPEIFEEPESPAPSLPLAPSSEYERPRVIRPRITLSPKTLRRIQGGGSSVSGMNY